MKTYEEYTKLNKLDIDQNDITIMYYWKFLSKDYLDFGLKKIGMNNREIKDFSFLHYKVKDVFYIIYNYNDLYHTYTWDWSISDPNIFYKRIYENRKIKFMGNVKIEEYEVDSELFNL